MYSKNKLDPLIDGTGANVPSHIYSVKLIHKNNITILNGSFVLFRKKCYNWKKVWQWI